MLFDSHAHINNDTYTDRDREALISEIEASDLSYVMDIGFDLESSVRAVNHAARLVLWHRGDELPLLHSTNLNVPHD